MTFYLRSMENNLLHKIRTGTREHHEALEARLIHYLKRIKTVADYTALLEAFYAFMEPVQEKILMYIDRSMLPDIDKRRSAGYLRDDLQALGSNRVTLGEAQIPTIRNNAEAFGALYVMEGSTLGGKTITAMIRKVLGAACPARFFEGYKENTGAMWKEFLEILDINETNLDSNELVECSKETFRLFGIWLDSSLKINEN